MTSVSIPSSENSALVQKIKILLQNKENKEKELKKIEEMLKKESEQIRVELEKTIKEIREEEERKFKEENELKIKKLQKKVLEETIKDFSQKDFDSFQEQVQYANLFINSSETGYLSIYDIANKQTYEKIKDILTIPEQFRTNEEWSILKKVSYNLDRIKREELYLSRTDPNEYIKRTQTLINMFYK